MNKRSDKYFSKLMHSTHIDLYQNMIRKMWLEFKQMLNTKNSHDALWWEIKKSTWYCMMWSNMKREFTGIFSKIVKRESERPQRHSLGSPTFSRSTLCMHSKQKSLCQCLLILERVYTTFYCQERHKFSFSITNDVIFNVPKSLRSHLCTIKNYLWVLSDFHYYWSSIKKEKFRIFSFPLVFFV